MHRHRFADQLSSRPAAENPLPSAQGFILYPLALPCGGQGPPCPWQHIYQVAYAQAQAVTRPSRLDRYQIKCWN